jgi:hypothetical protein
MALAKIRDYLEHPTKKYQTVGSVFQSQALRVKKLMWVGVGGRGLFIKLPGSRSLLGEKAVGEGER